MNEIPQLYLIILLIILIIVGAILLVQISRNPNRQTSEKLDSSDSNFFDSHSILLFKQFAEKEIDNLFNHITPDKKTIVKETQTLMGEGKFGSKIFPAEVGSSISQTIERQIKAASPLFKYEYIVRRLKQDNKLTIVDFSKGDDPEINQIKKLLKDIDLSLPPETMKDIEDKLNNRETVDKLLKNRFERHKKLNCLILDTPFAVRRNNHGYELVSEKDQFHETKVMITLSDDSLTPRGKEYFQSAIEQTRDFSIFGVAEICKSEDQEFISVSSLVVF